MRLATVAHKLFFVQLFSLSCFCITAADLNPFQRMLPDTLGHIFYFTLLPSQIHSNGEITSIYRDHVISPLYEIEKEDDQNGETEIKKISEEKEIKGIPYFQSMKHLMLVHPTWYHYCKEQFDLKMMRPWFSQVLAHYDEYLFLAPHWYAKDDTFKLIHEEKISPKERAVRKDIIKRMTSLVSRTAEKSQITEHEIAQTLNLHHFIGWHQLCEDTLLSPSYKKNTDGDADNPSEYLNDFLAYHYSKYVTLADYKDNNYAQARLKRYCCLFNQPTDKILLQLFQLFFVVETFDCDLKKFYPAGAYLNNPKPCLHKLLNFNFKFQKCYSGDFIKSLYSSEEQQETTTLQVEIELAFNEVKGEYFEFNTIQKNYLNILNSEYLSPPNSQKNSILNLSQISENL
jgi:hypothetical protein